MALKDIFTRPSGPAATRRVLQPSPKRERYLTELSKKEVTNERVREWMALKRLDPSGPVMSNSAQLASACKEILNTSSDPEVRRISIRAVDEMRESYSAYRVRDDGTPADAHPLSICYLGLMAGAEADWAIAALNHDRIEDGKLADFDRWKRNLGVADDHNGLLLSAYWYMDGITHSPLLDPNGKAISSLIKSKLSTPAGFRELEVQRHLDSLQEDYANYVTQIYQSGSVPLIQLKTLDTMHNAKSLRTMDPNRHFWRMYKTIWAAMIHLEAAKKISWMMAGEILRGIEGGLERMQQEGIGRFTLRRNWSRYRFHRYQKSPSQIEMEKRKVARTGPRAFFDPREQPYGASKVIILFCPENKNWLDSLGTDVKKPVPIEFEVPRYFESRKCIREMDEVALRRAIELHLPAGQFAVGLKPSLQLPVPGHSVLIWEIAPDPRLFDIVDRLERLPISAMREADELLDSGNEVYLGSIDDIKSRLSRIAKDVFRDDASLAVDIGYFD